jgi:UPF0042 nucleotide-binding protein
MGWEVVDNLPLTLLTRLLATQEAQGTQGTRPLALGIDSRTRGFDARAIVERIKAMREQDGAAIGTLFLDCTGVELERRYSETRRRHPLAPDRPASDGIHRERELVAPLRRWADHVIDTTGSNANDLKAELRDRFGQAGDQETVLSVMSFGFARGLPRNADLVFDMRFLRNPHWDDELRPLTGLDDGVNAYVIADPAYAEAMTRIDGLVDLLIPRYKAEGKSYLTIAFGCTGGRHRSVHCAQRMGQRLRDGGFAPSVVHRDINLANPASESPPQKPEETGEE